MSLIDEMIAMNIYSGNRNLSSTFFSTFLLAVGFLVAACSGNKQPTGAGGVGSIAVSQTAVSFAASQGGSSPAASAISVTSSGATIHGLTTEQEGTKPGWVDYSLSTAETPTTLNLSAGIRGVSQGAYLTATPVYDGIGSGFITATLNTTTAPATVTIRPAAVTTGWGAGSYFGTVEIRGDNAVNTPVRLNVNLWIDNPF